MFYNKRRFENKHRARIGDIVLIKEENIPQINWRKGKTDKLIFGNDGSVRGVDLLVKRLVQLVIPFEFCDPNKPAETHTDNSHPKRLATINADAIRRAIRSLVT